MMITQKNKGWISAFSEMTFSFRRSLLLGLAILLTITSISYGITFPQYQGYVNDYSHILSAADTQMLENLSTELHAKTGIQLVTVIVPSLDNESIDDYAIQLFKKWGIGDKKKNDGILFITAIQDKKVRIEVGYGLEGIVNDAKAGRLLDDYVIPLYRQGAFAKGVANGHVAIAQTLAIAHQVQLTGETRYYRSNAHSAKSVIPEWLQFLIFIGFILLIVRMGPQSIFLIPLLLMGSGGGGRNDSFGGFGGSGFDGFGGGFSGGGGASRGW